MMPTSEQVRVRLLEQHIEEFAEQRTETVRTEPVPTFTWGKTFNVTVSINVPQGGRFVPPTWSWEPVDPKEQQRLLDPKEQQRLHKEQKARDVKFTRAEKRARKLLWASLDKQQRKEWSRQRSFRLTTPIGRVYRIESGITYNVTLISGARLKGAKRSRKLANGRYLCAHISLVDVDGGRIPIEDNVLAQKLLLECPGGEEHFISLANPD